MSEGRESQVPFSSALVSARAKKEEVVVKDCTGGERECVWTFVSRARKVGGPFAEDEEQRQRASAAEGNVSTTTPKAPMHRRHSSICTHRRRDTSSQNVHHEARETRARIVGTASSTTTALTSLIKRFTETCLIGLDLKAVGKPREGPEP